MTTIAIVPTGYVNNSTDFLRVKCDRSGAVRNVAGTVSVPSGTAADAFVGLVPFRKGARFVIGDKSVHCGNFGAGTTTVNLGVVYADSTTDDVDAFASLSTAAQSGGFITVDEIEGMTLNTPTDGWLAVQLVAAAADATANITFNVGVVYDA
jgi:hypothetical protein